MLGRVAVNDAALVGFAHVVVHPNTWTTRPVGYLEDLYVAEDHRRGGVGRALIEAFVEEGRRQGWHRLYWMTKRDNRRARDVYDSLVPVTDWVRYDWPL